MTDRPDSTTGAGAHRSGMRARRRIVIPAIVLGGVVVVAIVYALGSRDLGPSLATSGIVQGNVLERMPGDAEWTPLRSIGAPIVPGTGLRTTDAGRLALTLTDGGSLRLDAGTALTIRTARSFELVRGSVYVDTGGAVVGDPYSVTTRLGTVDEIGSQVEVAIADDTLRLRVRDGDIHVAIAAGTETSAATGEQLHIDAAGDVARSYLMPHDGEWTWVETLAGTPIVDGRPLTQFLDWVARETGRPIRYDSPLTETGVGTALLRGTAENLAPMEALDVMLSTTEFDYTLRWDGSIVITPRQ